MQAGSLALWGRIAMQPGTPVRSLVQGIWWTTPYGLLAADRLAVYQDEDLGVNPGMRRSWERSRSLHERLDDGLALYDAPEHAMNPSQRRSQQRSVSLPPSGDAEERRLPMEAFSPVRDPRSFVPKRPHTVPPSLEALSRRRPELPHHVLQSGPSDTRVRAPGPRSWAAWPRVGET